MVPRSAPVREQTMTVAAVVLLVLTAAASADDESNIVAGLDNLDDLAPPPGSKWYDVLEETNVALSEALRRCELSSRGPDEDDASATATALLPTPPARAEPALVDLNDINANSRGDHPEDLFGDLRETAQRLVPPDIMARFGGAPEWTSQSYEERTAHLLHHTAAEKEGGRRLQWQWQDTSTWAQDDSLAAAVGGTELGCTDPLASNDGVLGTSCAYSCAALEQEYFPGQPTRCFLYDPSTQTWPADLLAMRQSRLETHTYIDQATGTNPIAGAALAFTVGSGRSCQNVTIASSTISTQATHTEVVCLVDGEHEYNHTITDEHTVEVVGYADSGVHTGAGGTTSFVIGKCTDVLVRVTTTGASGSPSTWSIDDGGHNGPWTFESAGPGVHEYVSCMFDNDFTLLREPSASSWQGSVEVIGFIQYHDTITIPNNENWIVQGNVDPATGLPVLLDARLSSGTPLNPSHTNIALRYVRFSGHTAPVDTSGQRVGHGMWFAGQGGSYGGAFRYEGGTSDPANPVQLAFSNVIFDHNRASSAGAVFINGRAGHSSPESSVQNWDSGIAATWDDCVFFRNYASAKVDGALVVANVWPMTFEWTDCRFIQNSVTLRGGEQGHDGYYWDSLSGLGPDRRVGFTSLVHTRTVYDGGYSSTGLVSALVCPGSVIVIEAFGPSDPDATWNLTLTDVTYRDHAVMLLPGPVYSLIPFAVPDKLFRLNVHVSNLTMSDNVALLSHLFDSMNFLTASSSGTVSSVAQSRFESNGNFNIDAQGMGGFTLSGPAAPPGFCRPLATFANSEWDGNAGGNGAAIYAMLEIDVQIDQCLFINNIATRGGGAIYFGTVQSSELFIVRSIFEANAVRSPQIGESNAPATVVMNTGGMGEGAGSLPIWRIDDGPVYGIGWDVCQAVIARSQWSVQHGFPPWIPTESEQPSSCANETYHVQTTYSK
jgi:predicted outer membrane repeat protein